MRRGFGRCAMVAPGPRMGGDFVSTFRGVLDGSPMHHGEVPNIFPKTWKREHAGLAGWRFAGPDGWIGGTRIADRSWRPTRGTGWVARGSELGGTQPGMRIGDGSGWASRYATRIGAGGLQNGGACLGAGPDGWNRRGPTQKVIACVSRGKSSPQRLFLKSMRH